MATVRKCLFTAIALLFVLATGCRAGLNATCNSTDVHYMYVSCSTNFRVLEQALYDTCDNKFELIRKFYPARETVTEYAEVTYTFLGTDIPEQHWIWTTGSFYLVQPPAVLRFTSLFIVYPENHIQKVQLYLPGECKDASTADGGMLEILTRRLKLYAKFNNIDGVVVEDYADAFAIAVDEKYLYSVYDADHEPYVIAVFFSLTIFLPIGSIVSFCLVLKGSRVQLRTAFNKPRWYPTFAASVAIGFWFSVFVVVLDICALVWSFDSSVDNELHDIFKDIATNNSNEHRLIDIPSLWFPICTAIINTVALVIGLVFILASCCCSGCCCLLSCIDWDRFCFWCKNCLDYKVMENKSFLIKNEVRMWWLCASFFAPLVCFSSHIGYIVVAWLADPHRGGGIFVVYVFAFLCQLIGLRVVYNVFRHTHKKRNDGDDELPLVGYSVEQQEHEYSHGHEEAMFSRKAFGMVLLFGGAFWGIEVYIATAFTLLPLVGAIKDPPQYILAIFEITVVLATILLTYKYFSEEQPIDRELLVSMIRNMKFYKNQEGAATPFRGTEVAKTGAVLGAIAYKLLEEGRIEQGNGPLDRDDDMIPKTTGCIYYCLARLFRHKDVDYEAIRAVRTTTIYGTT